MVTGFEPPGRTPVRVVTTGSRHMGERSARTLEASVMEANNPPPYPMLGKEPPNSEQPQRKCPPHEWRLAEGDRLDGDGFIVRICEVCGVESRKVKIRRHRSNHSPKKAHRAYL